MAQKNYKEELTCGLKNLNLQADETQIEKFLFYMDCLLEYNQKVNLTAIKNKSDIILKHFLDSVSILCFIGIKKNFKVIDIGTGAGFPGIPIKILFPEIELTLLDATEKRIKFLSYLQNQLDLKKINCINARAEDFIKKIGERESYDLCVSRAVAKLNILSEICLPFVKLNGFFVSYKGPEIKNELLQARECIKKLGGGKIDIKEINISDSENKNFIRHNLVFISKLFQSNLKYPRDYAKILKNPL